MHLHDRLTIDEKRRTRDGYLAVNARVARAGNIQLYSGAEVGKPSMDVVRVFRPADEVFSTDTMQSFAHRPVTLGHPDTSVTSTNWRDVAKGWSDGEVVREGEFVRVSMLLADAEAIDAVENGTRELSMGYDCSLDWTAGTTPAGEAYDAIQRGIRSNHIAVVTKARGGAELRIGDSAQHKALHMMTDAEKQRMRDSVRGMPLEQAAALPIFDDVRGLIVGGMAAERYYAITAGAIVDGVPSRQLNDSDRAWRQMQADMMNGWRQEKATSDEKADGVHLALDGRPLSALTDRERADDSYRRMCIDQSNAWRGDR